ncbi:MAG: DAK2 domain-containing protein, partial [Actinobacteria bacterium]|nr:DAK2 domain-containing protein [Actinomycetota bacterium]
MPDGVEVLPRGVSLEGVLRFTEVAARALEAAREEVDALNVYPVPDGDTGTNMYLTIAAARDAVETAVAEAGGPAECGVGPGLAALGRGALLGARGNSGVILSEMLRALARRLAEAGPEDRAAAVMADGMRLAADAAY